ncbi:MULTISPECIES: lactonase family protein [unclassified Knoellia]|uniref:lactonase family protein n=1 Tax=Knoellia altitudinis TaxID=3404795 RepID=UPI003621F1D4
MGTTPRTVWVAVASSPDDPSVGTVSLHPWDGGHGLGAAVASIELPRPGWVVWAPDGTHLHVACETPDGHVVTLMVEDRSDGPPALSQVGQCSTGGAHPCHLALMPDGRTLLAANYTDGTVSTIEVTDDVVTTLTDTARLSGSGPHPTRQEGSHAHQVAPLPDDRVWVVDLGGDQIVTYAVREGVLDQLTSSALPPGAGPRHVVRDPRTGRAWVGAELSGFLVALRENAVGRLEVTGQVLASSSRTENSVAQIWLDADAQRLLISNRGPDTLSVFDVAGDLPVLIGETAVPAHPRHFHADGERDILLVAGRDADAVTTHDLSPHRIGRAVTTLTVPAPMCVAPRPAAF